MYELRFKNRKTLLYKTDVEYGDWCLNHVENCAHGCRFPCYAMNMAKRFGRIKSYDDWLHPILVKNSLEILDKEIPKHKGQIKFVHLCFMTDPFMMGYPAIQDMTLEIIKKLNDNNIKATVLTKGIFPEELAGKKYHRGNEYGITLVSLSEKFREHFEPNTAKYKDRINGLKKLHDNGLRTWISMEPFPTPNLDTKQDLDSLLKSVGFVDKIIFGKLNYNVKCSAFENNKEFYEESAMKVIEFCSKNGIEYHIKFGTQSRDNRVTTNLFKNSKSSNKLKKSICTTV